MLVAGTVAGLPPSPRLLMRFRMVPGGRIFVGRLEHGLKWTYAGSPDVLKNILWGALAPMGIRGHALPRNRVEGHTTV